MTRPGARTDMFHPVLTFSDPLPTLHISVLAARLSKPRGSLVQLGVSLGARRSRSVNCARGGWC